MSMEEISLQTEIAKGNLRAGSHGTKALGAAGAVIRTHLGFLVRDLNRARTQAVAAQTDKMKEMIPGPADSFQQALDTLTGVVGESSNDHAHAALALTQQAGEAYNTVAGEATLIATALESALGLLAVAVEDLESIRARLDVLGDSVSEVAGAWNGPVGRTVGRLTGHESVPGIASGAAEEITQYQQDLGI